MISIAGFPANVTPSPLFKNIHLDQSQNIYFENFSLYAFSLQLLQEKNNFDLRNLIVGGVAQFDLQHWQGDRIAEYPHEGFYVNGTRLFFSQASLDLMMNLNQWSTAFVSASEASIGVNNRNGNYFYVPHAFFLLGNLDTLPIYSTVGINSIPFGVFAGSGPWDMPLTYAYFYPAQAPQISVGYYKNNLNAVVTAFKDEINYQSHHTYSLYYNNTIDDIAYNLGIGYLSDLKLNATQNASFLPRTLQKHSREINIGDLGAVYDLNAGISYHQFAFTGEYNQGQYKMNGNHGKPEALGFVAYYVKEILGKATDFGLGFSKTTDLRDAPNALSGNDSLSSAFHGLKDAYSLSVSRSLIDQIKLGLTLQRTTIYSGVLDTRVQSDNEKHTYTATLDLLAYL